MPETYRDIYDDKSQFLDQVGISLQFHNLVLRLLQIKQYHITLKFDVILTCIVVNMWK